ncbi:MAG: hypothetical protein KF862_20945 [Chitinophagaceae bacterium]|nr:hypothetical protein [Chitinophagaceae bacterium]
MSKEEIKNEINKVLDHLSDNSLQDVLTMLKGLEDKPTVFHLDQAVLDKILSDNNDLLEKLAK